MLQGTLTYRAPVKGPIFARFDRFELQATHPCVAKIEVGCPAETPVEVLVHFSSTPSEEAARIAGNQLCGHLLNRLAVKYGLSIESPGVPSGAFQQVGAGGTTTHTLSHSVSAFISGKRTEEIDATQAAALKAELEQPRLRGEPYFDLFRTAMQAEDAVDRFLSLYRILALLYPNPTSGKEEQKFVDDFLEQKCGAPRAFPRPGHPALKETVFTRLRNEIAHVRNVDLVATRNEMQQRVHDLAQAVQKAIREQPYGAGSPPACPSATGRTRCPSPSPRRASPSGPWRDPRTRTGCTRRSR